MKIMKPLPVSKAPCAHRVLGTGSSLALGVALGAGVGAALQNLAWGVAVGALLGAVIGVFSRFAKPQSF